MDTLSVGKENKIRAMLKQPRILALLLLILCMAVSIALVPIAYETNDDPGMMGNVNGAKTGEPEADTVFSLFLWGKLLAVLYTLIPGFPWYSVLFLALIALSQWIVFTEIIRMGKRIGRLWLGVLCSGALYALVFLYNTVRPQFTVVSAFCGLAALSLMLTRRGEEKPLPRLAAIFFLTLFSVNVRSKVAYLALGSGAAACGIELLGLLFSHGSGERKRILRTALLTLLVMAAAVGISVGVNRIHMQHSEGWAEFQEYHVQRAAYTDYDKPPYAGNEALYQSIGWNADLFSLTRSWFFMDEAVTKEAFQTINEYKAAEGQSPSKALALWTESLGKNRMVTFQAGIWLILLLGFAAFGVDWRRKGALRDLFRPAAWFALFLAETLYFAWGGRMVQRILEACLYLSAVPSLLEMGGSLAERGRLKGAEKEKSRRGLNAASVCCVIAAAVLILSVALPFGPFRKAAAEREDKAEQIRLRTAMEAYAMEHPENLYVYDGSLTRSTESPWAAFPDRRPSNLIFWGGSGYNSPLYYKQLAANGYDSLYTGDLLDGRVFFMGMEGPNSRLTRYIATKYPGAVYETADTGEGFIVYRYFRLNAPEIRVEAAGDGEALLSWNAVERADRYRVTRRHESEEKWSILGETAETSFPDDSVLPGETYYYQVRPAFGAAWGAYAQEGIAYTHAPARELMAVTVARVGENAVLLEYTGADAGDEEARYAWYVYRDGEKLDGLCKGYSARKGYLLPLEADGRYVFRCFRKLGEERIVCPCYPVTVENGVILPDPEIREITAEEAARSRALVYYLPAPEARLEPVGGSSVLVSWEASLHGEKYKVTRRHEGEERWHQVGETAGTSLLDTAAIPGETYYYRVRAGIDDYWGEYDPEGTAYTHEPTPEMMEVSVSRAGENAVLLDYIGPGAGEGGAAYAWYVFLDGKKAPELCRGFAEESEYLVYPEADGSYTFRCYRRVNGELSQYTGYRITVENGVILPDPRIGEISEETFRRVFPPVEAVATLIGERRIRLTMKNNWLDAGAGYAYAWYVYKDGERYPELDRQYAADPTYELTLPEDGMYRFKLFYRKGAEKDSLWSRTITVGETGD